MPSYRLPPDLQADLTWLWCEADADIGICSGGDIEFRAPANEDRQPSCNDLEIVEHRTWTKPKGATRAERRHAANEARDEQIRREFYELKCGGDIHVTSTDDPASCLMADHGVPFVMDRTPMPQWARRIVSRDRDRMRRVHNTVQRLLAMPNGPRHQRVLFRVYGPVQRHPVCYGRVGNELAPLVEYTQAVALRMGPTVTATEAGERALGKGATDRTVTSIRTECNTMLVDASKAYAQAHETGRAQFFADRRRKFETRLRGVA